METKVTVSNPKSFERTYADILRQLDDLPNKFRTYNVLISKKNEIKFFKKTNTVLVDLKSPAMK